MKTNLFMTLAAAFLLGACGDDGDNTGNLNGEVPAVFTTNLAQRVQTRAHDAAWDNGDAIGIFSLNDELTGVTIGGSPQSNMAVNTKYTTAGGNKWTSENAYRFKNPVSTEVEFKAYYPWVADNAITGGQSEKINGAISVDASTQTADGQKAFDFLFATKEGGEGGAVASHGSKDDPNVKFQFTHSMAKVILVFKAATDKGVAFDEDFKTMVPTLKGLKTQGTFSLADGVVTVSGKANDLILKNSTVDETGSTVTFTAILPPQAPVNDGSAPEVNIKIGNNDVYRSMKILGGQKMEAGKYYKYTITVKKMELIVSASTISDWGVGLDDGTSDAVLQ